MTKDELKVMLNRFCDMQAQVEYLCKVLTEDDKKNTTYQEKVENCALLKGALAILNERERFVIENHLIHHHTWTEINIKMSKQFNPEFIRSDRTLKRIQNRALEKMTIFINEVSMY